MILFWKVEGLMHEEGAADLGESGRLLLANALSEVHAPLLSARGPPTPEERAALVRQCISADGKDWNRVNLVVRSSSIEGPLDASAACAEHFGLRRDAPPAVRLTFKQRFPRFCARKKCFRATIAYSYEEEYQGYVTWGWSGERRVLAAFDRDARAWAIGPHQDIS